MKTVRDLPLRSDLHCVVSGNKSICSLCSLQLKILYEIPEIAVQIRMLQSELDDRLQVFEFVATVAVGAVLNLKRVGGMSVFQ